MKPERPSPTTLPLVRAQIAAYSAGLSQEDLIEVTRRLFEPAAFADWLDGFNTRRGDA